MIGEALKVKQKRKVLKMNYEQRINHGKAMTDEELTTCVLWTLNKINSYIKKYNNNYTNVKKQDAYEIQRYIIFWCSLFLAGQRREILTNMNINQIIIDQDKTALKQRKEKTIRTNSENIPIPTPCENFILFFYQNIRKFLVKDENVKALWLTLKGTPMAGHKIGELIARTYKLFNPFLTRTMIDNRRDTITMIFKELNDMDLNYFIPSLERWLNVSKDVMIKHYNR